MLKRLVYDNPRNIRLLIGNTGKVSYCGKSIEDVNLYSFDGIPEDEIRNGKTDSERYFEILMDLNVENQQNKKMLDNLFDLLDRYMTE